MQVHPLTLAGASRSHAGQEYAANMTRKKVKEDKMKARRGQWTSAGSKAVAFKLSHGFSPCSEERKQFHDEVEAWIW